MTTVLTLSVSWTVRAAIRTVSPSARRIKVSATKLHRRATSIVHTRFVVRVCSPTSKAKSSKYFPLLLFFSSSLMNNLIFFIDLLLLVSLSLFHYNWSSSSLTSWFFVTVSMTTRQWRCWRLVQISISWRKILPRKQCCVYVSKRTLYLYSFCVVMKLLCIILKSEALSVVIFEVWKVCSLKSL